MKAWTRLAVFGCFAAALVAGGIPAAADSQPGSAHSGPGSAGPDEHSQNMKLLANSPKPGVTNSDLAFDGKLTYAGNYGGFRILDTSAPANPKVLADFPCNGAQSDVSVFEGLLFQSVDSPQSHAGCDSSNVTASTPGMFEGIRVFDVSDPTAPEHIASIQTDCGSHTHTILPEPEHGRVLVYVSSYPLTAGARGPDCQLPHGYISIVEVPLDDPGAATVHKYFLDEDTALAEFDLSLLGIPETPSFVACHDISVFKELSLAAGACMSEAQLWDISDPLAPELIWRFDHEAVDPGKVDLWHSAAFSWDGSVVAFGDESGGSAVAGRCADPDDLQGRIWFLDVDSSGGEGELLSTYKIPRSDPGVCTAHIFNFIPLKDGAKVLVSAFNTGGTTVVDVDALLAGATEAEAEIGFYRTFGGNAWASYWHNGFIFVNDRVRGLDVMLLSDKARAGAAKLDLNNPQSQEAVIR